jgi:uncharacterized delta-60 repeat protein
MTFILYLINLSSKKSILKSLLLLFLIFRVMAAPGDFDLSFGNGGKVVYRFNDREDTFQGVVIQPDGKIVVAGDNGAARLIVLRYHPNGSLDTSFATGGILTLPPLSGAVCESLALQADGKIVLAGLVNVTSGNSGFLVIRVNQNGTLDTTFDGDGFLTTDLTNRQDIANDIDIQADGKIVVAGSTGGLSKDAGNIGVVRYNTNGTLDTSFDGDGIVITTIGSYVSRGYAVKLQTDGKIVVSASCNAPFLTETNLAVVRYLTNGALDSSFGSGGVSLTPLGGQQFQFGDLEIQSDNKIVVLGSVGLNTTFVYDFSVFRFFSNGAPDMNFGTNGRKVIDSGDTNSAQALELQTDGKILAVGHSWVQGNSLDILVARLNTDGSFDSGYGTNGKVYTQVGVPPASDYGWDAALQPDGKLIVVGDFNVSFFDYDAVILRFLGDSIVQRRSPFDFDGDNKTDVSIFRPSAGEWWYLRSSDAGNRAAQFGNSLDKPTPADFTGDGKTDITFWRPSTGEWFILRSEDASYLSFPFGAAGDVPVVGDFDLDGRADPTVYRPSTNEWYILKSTGGVIITTFGTTGDVPVPADYDGDGKTDIAIYRPSNGQWWINRSSNGQTVAAAFGTSADKPVQGDYSGDGKADIAFWRGSTGEWFILRSEDASYYTVPFGALGDIPAPGDYDGDGRFDTAVFRPTGSTWYVNRTTAGLMIINFGTNGDRPIPNVFVP